MAHHLGDDDLKLLLAACRDVADTLVDRLSRQATRAKDFLQELGEDPLLPRREVGGVDLRVAEALVECLIEVEPWPVGPQDFVERLEIGRLPVGREAHELVLVVGHLEAEILGQHSVIEAEAVVAPEADVRAELSALAVQDHARSGVAGVVEA